MNMKNSKSKIITVTLSLQDIKNDPYFIEVHDKISNTEDIKKIIEKMIGEINDRLKSKGIRLHIDPAAKEFLLFKGYEPEYGARHLKRTIQQYIEDPLSTHILKREFAENSEIEVTVEDGLIKFHSMEGLSV